jgi:hypothetical protein
MTTKTVFQTDRAGHFVSVEEADESPLEPGVYLMPRGCVEVAPPDEWPEDKWPRWNGRQWELILKPKLPANDNDPVAKLQAFLAANPDVAAIINQGGV